ncbi:MAG: alpha/beta hydrolase [Bacteroidales bacterium]
MPNSYLTVQHKKIYYSDQGKGFPVVLLHGYLESLSIWGDFIDQLAENFRVIAFDIPGHGRSDTLSEKHTMEQLAECIFNALKQLSIKKCFMIGHSMGGYITLMFHQLYPEKLAAFSLFHSHPFADTVETKKNRLREMDLVKSGKKDLIAKVNIPNAYAFNNLVSFKDHIERSKAVALNTPDDGIIANVYAMMNRPDLSEPLANSLIPFLFIAGKNDNYIPFDAVVPKIKLPRHSDLIVLEQSGHMGFIEEKEKTAQSIKDFVFTHLKINRIS